MTYTITKYTYDKAKELGYTVKPSTLKNKKIDVYKDGNKIGSVGAIGYMDFPTWIEKKGLEYANNRRKLFHERFKKSNSLNSQLAKDLLW